MRHYDLSPLTRNHRAWDNDRYYQRDAQDEPTAEERGECPCGSGLPVDADGGCVVCWFERTEPKA